MSYFSSSGPFAMGVESPSAGNRRHAATRTDTTPPTNSSRQQQPHKSVLTQPKSNESSSKTKVNANETKMVHTDVLVVLPDDFDIDYKESK
ncbi:hypothetical protein MPSEU_000020400 [Mayamaea pseudoterrestris]|nr:hypothetical protein MPSEU_000020400 [Mayamaea pseudoterrestris]